MSLTDIFLRPLLRTSGARPFITHYDDVAGTRIELSVTTMANWAAKTANWLVEEVDVVPGDRVAVRLPAHWQTAAILLGAWWCGAHIVHDDQDARIAFVSPDASTGGDTAQAQATAVVALDPLGRGLSAPPGDGVIDFLNEVRLAGDDFVSLNEIPGNTPALFSMTITEAADQARALATEQALTPTARVLSTLDWNQPTDTLHGFLAPLAAGAHLVQVTPHTPEALPHHQATEQTTHTLTQ